MRHYLLFISLLVPSFLSAQAKTAEELREEDLKKYSIESAEINYKISGDADGEELMAFNDFGWMSLRQQTMTFELYGITSTQSVYEITDGDFVYRLNPDDSTYSIRKDYKWSQQASYKNPEQVSEAILFSMGGKQQAYKTHLEKNCQVWTFEGKAIQELWVWNGLVLKRKAKLGDRLIETTATKITIDISPNPILFTIPEYFQKKN
ncbi:hypothetical protein SAMN05421640_3484 [Ekhidna lutea]|uniref:DUF4412 domain-containing protein n=1 Tax=Ekhidna lutea TaxID=447679 RepID=A0A239LXW4_EKHLU|nr:hypothetical protein [Ekhidna lutea]SNT35356.1 hypothetical protein SAMN05421640_3484 [Ekhidna lutea]